MKTDIRRELSSDSGSVGFTFTELLVVVALAAILGAMILPSLNSASDTLKAAICVGNMHQWGMAIGMYCDDWKDVFPHEGTFGTALDQGSNPGAWYNVVPRYIGQPRLVDLYNAGNPPLPHMKSVWICPAATSTVTSVQITRSTPYFSYAFNARMDPNNGGAPPCPPNSLDIGGGDCRFRRSQLTSPANTIIFCETDGPGGSVGAATTVAHHFGGANFVLGDGHVEWVKYEDYCRSCPSNNAPDTDSSVFGDWASGIKYHLFPFKGAST